MAHDAATQHARADEQLRQRMWTPLMLRAMTRRWISDVPSKIV
jgi:hypothetical protein